MQFIGSDEEEKQDDILQTRIKVSKMAVLGLLILPPLVVLSLGLALCYRFYFSMITAAIPLLIALKALSIINHESPKVKGKIIAILQLFISVLLILATLAVNYLWRLDADPIKEDYTALDLVVVPAEYDRSYQILRKLAISDTFAADGTVTGLKDNDTEVLVMAHNFIFYADPHLINQNAADIQQVWQNAQKGRSIIDQLDAFPQIADLTQPKPISQKDADKDQYLFNNLLHLNLLYRAHSALFLQTGNHKIAIDDISKINSVLRKLLVSVRPIEHKAIYSKIISKNIEYLNIIVNNPDTPKQAIASLAENNPPFTQSELSWRNSLIFEYLLFKSTLHELYPQNVKSKNSAVKHNSASRLFKNKIDLLIENKTSDHLQNNIWPEKYPSWLKQKLTDLDSDLGIYMFYNPAGHLTSHDIMQAIEQIIENRNNLSIYYDILQFSINCRLSTPATLPDQYTFDSQYTIDTEKKIITHPGPDGKPNTNDDISMTINPEVLNLTLEDMEQ